MSLSVTFRCLSKSCRALGQAAADKRRLELEGEADADKVEAEVKKARDCAQNVQVPVEDVVPMVSKQTKYGVRLMVSAMCPRCGNKITNFRCVAEADKKDSKKKRPSEDEEVKQASKKSRVSEGRESSAASQSQKSAKSAKSSKAASVASTPKLSRRSKSDSQ